MSSNANRYSPPYFESYDEISFNMEIPGGTSRSRCATPSRYDTRESVRGLRGRTTASEHFLPRRIRQSTPEEDAYNRRQIISTPKIPSYTEALLASSRQNRVRALSPPIVLDEPQPRVSLRTRASSIEGSKPPRPTVGSDCYRRNMRSIYDRQPLFQDFLQDEQVDSSKYTGLYNLTDIYRMKSNFQGMLADKYKKMTYNDPAVDANIGRKLLPWKDHLRLEEPASKRILQEQNRQGGVRSRVSLSPVPRLTVYHRSTHPPRSLY